MKSAFLKSETSTRLQFSSPTFQDFTDIPQSVSVTSHPMFSAPGRTCVWTRRLGLISHACANTAADWKQDGSVQLSRLCKASKLFQLPASINTSIFEHIPSTSG